MPFLMTEELRQLTTPPWLPDVDLDGYLNNSFLEHLGGSFWRVAAGIHAESLGHQLVLPVGVISDLVSIPGLARIFIKPYSCVLVQALFHDDLYATQRFPRELADEIFLDLMCRYDVGTAQRNAFFTAVRVGGWLPWSLKTDLSIARARAVHRYPGSPWSLPPLDMPDDKRFVKKVEAVRKVIVREE